MSLDNPKTRAEIDLHNLAFNFRSIRGFVGEKVKILAVVKADAYGHGAVECSKRLETEGADWFGVATIEEAVELRKANKGSYIHNENKVYPKRVKKSKKPVTE